MKLLLLTLLFSISVAAQNTPKKSDNVFTTTVDGKSAYSGNIELKRDQVLNGPVALKPDRESQTIPKISGLELFIPGYPVVNVKGDKLDEEAKNKIKGLKKGEMVVIRVIPQKASENEKRATILPCSITLTD
jgi:hypothetical protein